MKILFSVFINQFKNQIYSGQENFVCTTLFFKFSFKELNLIQKLHPCFWRQISASAQNFWILSCGVTTLIKFTFHLKCDHWKVLSFSNTFSVQYRSVAIESLGKFYILFFIFSKFKITVYKFIQRPYKHLTAIRLKCFQKAKEFWKNRYYKVGSQNIELYNDRFIIRYGFLITPTAEDYFNPY